MPTANLTPTSKQPTAHRSESAFNLFPLDDKEQERAEYKSVVSNHLDRLLNDPATIEWLDTPADRRSPNPYLPNWQVYELEMRLEDQHLSRFREALQTLMAEPPAEMMDDEKTEPKHR